MVGAALPVLRTSSIYLGAVRGVHQLVAVVVGLVQLEVFRTGRAIICAGRLLTGRSDGPSLPASIMSLAVICNPTQTSSILLICCGGWFVDAVDWPLRLRATFGACRF